MPSNCASLPLQHLNPTSSQTTSFSLQSTHQQAPPLPAVTFLHYTAHNIDRSQELPHAPLYHVNHTIGTNPPAPSVVTSATNYTNQCKWLVNGIPCGQCFDAFDDLIVHLGREHDVKGPSERQVICYWCTHRGSCGNQYRRDAYRRHIATHLDVSFPCTVTDCNKSFSRADSLRSHVKKKHTKG